jgi:hypothetical protein
VAHVKFSMIDAISRNAILLLARAASHLALNYVVVFSDGNKGSGSAALGNFFESSPSSKGKREVLG